jgi:hypothetical protein
VTHLPAPFAQTVVDAHGSVEIFIAWLGLDRARLPG